jgi:hypothetical protein
VSRLWARRSVWVRVERRRLRCVDALFCIACGSSAMLAEEGILSRRFMDHVEGGLLTLAVYPNIRELLNELHEACKTQTYIECFCALRVYAEALCTPYATLDHYDM